MRINPDIEEKPNHLHYPACLGRMQEIKKQSLEIFVYTAIVFLIFGVFSVAGVKFNVFAVIPDLLFDGHDLKVAFFQIIEFIIVTVVSLLGCTRYKVFDVIIMLMYALMVLLSVVCHYNSADPVVFIAGACGIWKSICSFRVWSDYEQLKQTEGFPIFSLILTEHEEKNKNNAGNTNNISNTGNPVFDNAINNTFDQLDPSSGLAQSLMQATAGSNNTSSVPGMPSINTVPLPENKYTMKRYMPAGDKEGGILESPIKFTI
jgi:hypothetical protein